MEVIWETKHFNELSLTELYNILKLRSDVFVVEQRCIFLDIDDNDQNHYHCIGKIGEDIVATTRLFRKGQHYEDYQCIGRVCTSSKYRGKGLGRKLMEFSIKECSRLFGNGEPIRIGAQAYLQEFYGSFGFCKCGDDYIEDDIPHIPMLRQPDRAL